MKQKILINAHNKYAPYWAVAFILLLTAGLSTTWFQLGNFWNGYLLDAAGPAWSYILFRGLYTVKAKNRWTQFFTPKTTLTIILTFAYGIEILQYFNFYNSTFDPGDFIAYSSLILPMFFIDRYQNKREIFTN